MRRTELLHVRISADERRKLEGIAHIKKTTVSEEARRALRSWIDQEFQRLADSSPEIMKITIASPVEVRGSSWRDLIMPIIENIARPDGEFVGSDIYAHATKLSKIKPNNNFIDEKVRQTLGQLCRRGVIERLARGRYRLVRAEKHAA